MTLHPELLRDPLFLAPFLTGLAHVLGLALLGLYLRLRNEWIVPLALSQLSAAGAVTALALAGPQLVGGLLAAGLAAGARSRIDRAGEAGWVALMLAAWASMLLIAANTHAASDAARTLLDGQLLLAGQQALWPAMLVVPLAVLCLWRGGMWLRLARLQPAAFRARCPYPRVLLVGFDLLAACLIALATLAMGAMACFATSFLPAWLAFRCARHWRAACTWALLFAVLTYVLAFVLALVADQPFAPVFILLQGMAAIILRSLRG